MTIENPLLSARDIEFAYDGAPVLSEVALELHPGSLIALIGPNGSGKTTLLKLLAGILQPKQGTVEWQAVDMRKFSRRDIARKIALVPQELNVAFGFTVREMVMLGRTPHLAPFSGPTRHDRQVVQDMLNLAEISDLADRMIGELSGGEKQRVVIAMALAQEPQVLLLDEPTVHLDINHQIEILELLQRLNRSCGLTVLATMHDLNLAALFFQKLIMLKRGHVVASGSPASVLSAEQIRQVFDAAVYIQSHPTSKGTPQVLLLPTLPG